jgi:hypothetical protein
VKNSLECCSAFRIAAKAPGIATIWPSSKAGCFAELLIGKIPFVGLGVYFSDATHAAAHKKQMPFVAGESRWDILSPSVLPQTEERHPLE